MHDLAVLCESNSKYVSQVINERIGMSFSQYLNECRVSVARRRFMDFENFGHLTVEAIVTQLGYKSRSTFSKTFKRITGLTPTEFQRMAKEKPILCAENEYGDMMERVGINCEKISKFAIHCKERYESIEIRGDFGGHHRKPQKFKIHSRRPRGSGRDSSVGLGRPD